MRFPTPGHGFGVRQLFFALTNINLPRKGNVLLTDAMLNISDRFESGKIYPPP